MKLTRHTAIALAIATSLSLFMLNPVYATDSSTKDSTKDYSVSKMKDLQDDDHKDYSALWNSITTLLPSFTNLNSTLRADALVRKIGDYFQVKPSELDNRSASKIAQFTFSAGWKNKLDIKPRLAMDKVREIWKLKDGTVMTVYVKDKPFQCTVTGGGSSLSCDEEPVSKC